MLFIDAKNEVKVDKGIAYLKEEHIQKIYNTYKEYSEVAGFSKIVDTDLIMSKNGSLKINFYVKEKNSEKSYNFSDVFSEWNNLNNELNLAMNDLLNSIEK